MSHTLDLSKELYFFEIGRRDKLNSASSIPIGFATLSSASIAYCADAIRPPLGFADWLSITLISLGALTGFFFFYTTVRFFWGPVYKYIPLANVIEKHSEELRLHSTKYPKSGSHDDLFRGYLSDTFSFCASINCQNNDEKSRLLFKMNASVLAMLAPILLASLITGTVGFIDRTMIGNVSMANQNEPPPPPPPPPRDVRDGAHTPVPKTK
ncbi:MAG: hypothetical protein JNM03_12630 [Sphingopyxis sp.]|uniref:hypothetical protein n=1 Tax=Sphingopyxis sp. TaxID=1908224 RepID=UPI001A590BAC|nr:hypothetical protein [Sphingopyxis sp.]MBL9070821.1 hypothetical protein [Sphingopyxis sp.]